MAFIMLFTILPMNVFADESLHNGLSGSYSWSYSGEPIGGNAALINDLNSMNGYKISVYFAEIDEVATQEVGEPVYFWGDPLRSYQVGEIAYWRRCNLQTKSGKTVGLDFWSGSNIYDQVTNNTDWEHTLVSSRDGEKFYYAATEWQLGNASSAFKGCRAYISNVAVGVKAANLSGFSLYSIAYNDISAYDEEKINGFNEVRDFMCRMFDMENPKNVNLRTFHDALFSYYSQHGLDINNLGWDTSIYSYYYDVPNDGKSAEWVLNEWGKGILYAISEIRGLNIDVDTYCSSAYNDYLYNKLSSGSGKILATEHDFQLPFPSTMHEKSTTGKNNASGEYLKSYFLNPLILNEISYMTRPHSRDCGLWDVYEFIRGTYRKGGTEEVVGQYKIYIEPVMFRKYEVGKNILHGVVSWHDLMTQSFQIIDENGGNKTYAYKGFISDIVSAVGQIANAMMLEQPDESLIVDKGSGLIVGSNGLSKQLSDNSNELLANNGWGSKGIYTTFTDKTNTLGVSIVTSPSTMGSPMRPNVIKTYVTISGVDEDGTVHYSKAADTVSHGLAPDDFILDEQGNLTVHPKIKYLETTEMGTAILNDIFTTPYDLTISQDTKWLDTPLITDVTISNSANILGETNEDIKSQLEPTAQDVAGYLFGIVTGSETFIDDYHKNLNIEITTNDDGSLKTIDDILADVETLFLNTSDTLASANEKLRILEPKKNGGKYKAYKIIESVEFETTYDVGVGKVVENDIEKIDFTIEDDSWELLYGVTTPANTLVLRYILIPDAKQINIIEVVKADGTKEYYNGGVQPLHRDVDTVTIQDPNLDNFTFEDEPELVEWVTNSEYPIITVINGNLPAKSEGGKEGTTQDDITDYPDDPLVHNLYVKWVIEEPAPEIPGKLEVPEWRLSKYWEGYADMNGTEGVPTTTVGMSLSPSFSCHGSTSLTSKDWDYYAINPNGDKDNESNHAPSNLKLYNWLHSESIKSDETRHISISNYNVTVHMSANVNAIKSTDTAGLNAAKWLDNSVKNSEGTFALDTDYSVTQSYKNGTSTQDYIKNTDLTVGVYNKDTYVNKYNKSGSRSYTKSDGSKGRKHVCIATSKNLTPGTASYTSGTIAGLEIKFNRYNQEANNSLYKTNPEVKNNNGFTSLKYQLNETLNIYPEYGMLFTDDTQKDTIKWMVGDEVRKINPVVYQTLEHKVYVVPNSTGSSVATDTRALTQAKTIGEQGKQIIYKGAAVNTAFQLYKSDKKDGVALMTAKTYALDFKSGSHYSQFNGSGSAWGNNYNSYDEHSALLTNITSSNKAAVTSKLLVDSPAFNSLDYTGAEKRSTSNPYKIINYTSNNSKLQVVDGGKAVVFEHELIVRGGHLIGIKYNDRTGGDLQPTSITSLKAKDEALYNAILGMGLYVADNNKDNTVFKVFEHKDGDKLTEASYASLLASTRQSLDGIATPDYAAIKNGDKWYSEDTTVLVIKEYVSNFEVPSISVSDKLSMTVNGLNTPANKAQFFNVMGKGHTYLKYSLNVTPPSVANLGSTKVEAYFEYSSFGGDNLNNGIQKTDYVVPNVSITDTTRAN